MFKIIYVFAVICFIGLKNVNFCLGFSQKKVTFAAQKEKMVITMKKFYLLLAMLIGLICSSKAAADELIINDVVITPGGTVDVPMDFKVSSDRMYVGFTLNLVLPEGISTVKDEDGVPVYDQNSSVLKKFTVITSEHDGFAAIPQTTSARIQGTEGTLLTFQLQADASLAGGSLLTATVANVSFTTKDANGTMSTVAWNDVTFNITVASSQTWVAPEAPVNPANELLWMATDVQPGGNYFIMNVGEAQFLTGANNWGTQISLSDNATPYMQVTVEESPTYENTYMLVRTNDNSDVFYGYASQGRDSGFSPTPGWTHLFRDGEYGYVDMNNQGGDQFVLTRSPGGYYYIQSQAAEGLFPNAAAEYAGGTGAGNPVSFIRTEGDVDIEWAFIPVESIDMASYEQKAAAYAEAWPLYQERLLLYDVLNQAQAAGVDYTRASMV